MLDKTKKILVFSTAFRPMVGGSELAMENIIQRLPDIFFDILTPRYTKIIPAKERGANFNVYRIGAGKGLDKFLFPILGFLKAIGLRRNNPYSTIHAYQASQGAGAAWLYKTVFPKTRFIVTLQEGKSLEGQNWFVRFSRNLILKKADEITAISNYLLEYAKKINPQAKLFLIPNGVDLERFKNSDHIRRDNKIIITTSRLVPKNGLSDLISAFALVKKDMPNVKLNIVGEGPLRQELSSKINALELSQSVSFKGEVPHSEIDRHLGSADVFVRPSLSEGLGTSFLEAMAMGLPVIGTTVMAGAYEIKSGIADFLIDGETGLSCEPHNPKDIADKIKLILKDENLALKLSKNGREFVSKHYSWDKVSEEFRSLYAEQ